MSSNWLAHHDIHWCVLLVLPVEWVVALFGILIRFERAVTVSVSEHLGVSDYLLIVLVLKYKIVVFRLWFAFVGSDVVLLGLIVAVVI